MIEILIRYNNNEYIIYIIFITKRKKYIYIYNLK